jgi:hypothetical protein
MKILASGLFALLVASGAFCLAKTNSREVSMDDDVTEVGVNLDKQLAEAYHQGNWAQLERLVAPDYSGITEDFEWDFASLKREFPKIRLSEWRIERQRIKRLASDLILVNNIFWMQETFDGQDISGRYCSSNVWVRRNERWLLLVEQEVRLRDVEK